MLSGEAKPWPGWGEALAWVGRSLGLGGAYKRETSSATISAAGWDCLASATLCPAHSDIASISPVVPTSGGAGAYRTIGSPEAKCAIPSPSPGRLPGGGRPAASHLSAVELWRAR